MPNFDETRTTMSLAICSYFASSSDDDAGHRLKRRAREYGSHHALRRIREACGGGRILRRDMARGNRSRGHRCGRHRTAVVMVDRENYICARE